VYRAIDSETGSTVCVKLNKPSNDPSKDEQTWLNDIIPGTEDFDHPNILALFTAGKDDVVTLYRGNKRVIQE